MQVFADTTAVADIRLLAGLDLLDRIAANPSLIVQSGRKLKATVAEICAITEGPFNTEVVATDAEGMITEGRALHWRATLWPKGNSFYCMWQAGLNLSHRRFQNIGGVHAQATTATVLPTLRRL